VGCAGDGETEDADCVRPGGLVNSVNLLGEFGYGLVLLLDLLPRGGQLLPDSAVLHSEVVDVPLHGVNLPAELGESGIDSRKRGLHCCRGWGGGFLGRLAVFAHQLL